MHNDSVTLLHHFIIQDNFNNVLLYKIFALPDMHFCPVSSDCVHCMYLDLESGI